MIMKMAVSVVASPRPLRLRSTSSLSSFPLPSLSSSSFLVNVAASTVSKLSTKRIDFRAVSTDGLSKDLPSVTVRRRPLALLTAAAGTGGATIGDGVECLSDSDEEDIVTSDERLLDAKLQRKLEKKVRVKLTKKAKLRRKKLLRKRRMRKRRGQ